MVEIIIRLDVYFNREARLTFLCKRRTLLHAVDVVFKGTNSSPRVVSFPWELFPASFAWDLLLIIDANCAVTEKAG